VETGGEQTEKGKRVQEMEQDVKWTGWESWQVVTFACVGRGGSTRPPPCATHLMYLKAWQYGSVCSGRGEGAGLFS